MKYELYCDFCGESFSMDEYPFIYCPYCGKILKETNYEENIWIVRYCYKNSLIRNVKIKTKRQLEITDIIKLFNRSIPEAEIVSVENINNTRHTYHIDMEMCF